jgi:hypothetical protein
MYHVLYIRVSVLQTLVLPILLKRNIYYQIPILTKEEMLFLLPECMLVCYSDLTNSIVRAARYLEHHGEQEENTVRVFYLFIY